VTRRIAAILSEPDVQALGDGASRILVEDFVPGVEVSLEGEVLLPPQPGSVATRRARTSAARVFTVGLPALRL
jgi:hypothetical protein